MSGLRGFPIFFFFVVFVPAVMAADLLVRKGSEVTLTCDLSWLGVGRECNRTTWNFRGIRASWGVELVHLGKVQRDGLVLTADCSLVIKRVAAQNAGNYVCSRFQKDPGRRGEDVLEGRSSVDLDVVTVEEQRDEKEEKFNCIVSSFNSCGYTVRWNLGAVKVDKDDQQIKRTEGDCSATLSIPRSHFLFGPDLLTCEVTHLRSGNITVFRVSGTPTTKPHGRFLSLVVRIGDNVTLPCPNTTEGRCPRPAWTFNRTSGGSADVVESFRLSVAAADCSLMITEVDPQDAGVYFCRAASTRDRGVELTVVGLVECRSERFVGLECQVTGPSNQAVRWTNVPDVDGVEQSMSQNFASVSFAVSHPVDISGEYRAWRCGVEDHAFALPAPPPREEPGFSSLDVVMVVMHVVEVVLMAVVIVVLLRASGNRKWSGGEAAFKLRDGRESTANYENVGLSQ